MSKLEDLPDEITVKIFKNLNIGDLFSWSQVSKKFRAISQDECFWKKVNICDEKIPFGLVKQIIQNGCTFLSLYHCNVFGANTHFSKTSQLKYLDLSFGKVNLATLKTLLSSCHSLQKLSLANLYLNLEIIKILCTQNGQTLQVLDLAFCKGLAYDSDCLKWIVNNCLTLTELNLNFTGLSKASVRHLTKHLTPKITKLNIGHLKWIDAECVGSLVSRCKKITALDLKSTSITADAIHAILIHLKLSLEELDVNGPNMEGYFQYIRHSQMDRDKDMLSTMKNLKVFNCTSLKKDFVAQLKQKHPGLSINQKDLKIATPEQSLNPDFGFWDIQAAKVSYLGPEKGLCEASGNSSMLCDTSMLQITDMMRLSFLEPDLIEPDLMLNKMMYVDNLRKHRPSLAAFDDRASKKMDSDHNGLEQLPDIDDFEADDNSDEEEEE